MRCRSKVVRAMAAMAIQAILTHRVMSALYYSPAGDATLTRPVCPFNVGDAGLWQICCDQVSCYGDGG